MHDPPFVITVVRSGGFAGLRREWSVEVSSPDEAARWDPIIEACPWEQECDDGSPDAFVYALRVADRTAMVPEVHLEGPWRTLVDEVRRSSDDGA